MGVGHVNGIFIEEAFGPFSTFIKRIKTEDNNFKFVAKAVKVSAFEYTKYKTA